MKSRQAKNWTRLDNAAQLYASSSSKRDPKVFRFACELTEPVEPFILQQALERTVQMFPLFRSVLRKGLFWYFLEQSDRTPQALLEAYPPCSLLVEQSHHHFLFSVSYYHCRINLDIHHVLADGTGALQFLRMLVYHYLLAKHPDTLGVLRPSMDFDASDAEKKDDSFRKYYTGKPAGIQKQLPVAARPHGARLNDYRVYITAGEMSVQDALAAAKSLGGSLTAYICAQLICAIHEDLPLRKRGKPITLAVPVNLRNYFESVSTRNFFSVFHVSYTFGQGLDNSFETVFRSVSKSFAEELTTERLTAQMNRMAAIEQNPFSRIIPLTLKNISLSIADAIAARHISGGVSNLGRITMPEELTSYIRVFDVFLNSNRVQICACSFGDRLMITLASPFVSTNIQKNFFRAFSHAGIAVTIHSNPLVEDIKEAPSDALL